MHATWYFENNSITTDCECKFGQLVEHLFNVQTFQVGNQKSLRIALLVYS
jgi:hypothetical protein